MRIGYILQNFPKLSETFILNEIITLRDRGHSVIIFSIFNPEEKIIHKEIEEYNLIEYTYYYDSHIAANLMRQRLIPSDYLYSKLNFLKPLIEKCYSKKIAKYFSNIAKNMNLDVIHAHFNSIAVEVALNMSDILDIPFTFTTHAFDIFINPNNSVLKNRMMKANNVVTISNYNKEYLFKITNVEKEKIHVIRACPIFNTFNKIKVENKSIIIITVARFIEKKGIEYGILAIKELKNFYPDIRFNIVGSGPLRYKYEKLINRYDLNNNVFFLGNLDNLALNKELNRANIFLLPCVQGGNGDMDGIPVSLMEAMFLEIPVISTNISGIPELIEDGIEGYLVTPGNYYDIVKVVKNLIENKALRENMGRKGKIKVLNKFNINMEICKLEKIWEKNNL